MVFKCLFADLRGVLGLTRSSLFNVSDAADTHAVGTVIACHISTDTSNMKGMSISTKSIGTPDKSVATSKRNIPVSISTSSSNYPLKG